MSCLLRKILFPEKGVGDTHAVVLRVRSIPFHIHGCQILALNHEDVELPQLLHVVQWKLNGALNFNTAVVAAIHARNTAADLRGHKPARLKCARQTERINTYISTYRWHRCGAGVTAEVGVLSVVSLWQAAAGAALWVTLSSITLKQHDSTNSLRLNLMRHIFMTWPFTELWHYYRWATSFCRKEGTDLLSCFRRSGSEVAKEVWTCVLGTRKDENEI